MALIYFSSRGIATLPSALSLSLSLFLSLHLSSSPLLSAQLLSLRNFIAERRIFRHELRRNARRMDNEAPGNMRSHY